MQDIVIGRILPVLVTDKAYLSQHDHPRGGDLHLSGEVHAVGVQWPRRQWEAKVSTKSRDTASLEIDHQALYDLISPSFHRIRVDEIESAELVVWPPDSPGVERRAIFDHRQGRERTGSGRLGHGMMRSYSRQRQR
jgi:hypothetical protein